MSERRQFVTEYLRATTSMTALCASYGISRRVGYKWIARFFVDGDHELRDRSRRPHTSPWAVAGTPEDDQGSRTRTGACRSVEVPSPSCRDWLLPQQYAARPAVMAQVWNGPAAMDVYT